jgi:hypothetical protein
MFAETERLFSNAYESLFVLPQHPRLLCDRPDRLNGSQVPISVAIDVLALSSRSPSMIAQSSPTVSTGIAFPSF